jgi:hypothetical protein
LIVNIIHLPFRRAEREKNCPVGNFSEEPACREEKGGANKGMKRLKIPF